MCHSEAKTYYKILRERDMNVKKEHVPDGTINTQYDYLLNGVYIVSVFLSNANRLNVMFGCLCIFLFS